MVTKCTWLVEINCWLSTDKIIIIICMFSVQSNTQNIMLSIHMHSVLSVLFQL